MNINKIIVYVTIFAIVFLITIPTVNKVVANHNKKAILVTEKLLIESAQRCHYEGVCKDKIIKLEDLYAYHYLKDEAINPITKEVYSKNAFVKINKNNAKFYPKY